jgi:hypothetical protein
MHSRFRANIQQVLLDILERVVNYSSAPIRLLEWVVAQLLQPQHPSTHKQRPWRYVATSHVVKRTIVSEIG